MKGDPKRMTEGNRKVKGAGVLIFDLTPIASCPNHEFCAATCYAMDAEITYPDTRNFRAENLDLAKNSPALLSELLCAQIARKSALLAKKGADPLVVRIHSAGDFFSAEYLALWVNVAAAFPGVTFWGYTKTRQIWDFSAADSLPNLNIIDSFIDGKYRNYGQKDYVDALMAQDPEIFLCQATTEEGHDAVFCSTNCTLCLKGKKPIFYAHGRNKKRA